MSKKRVYAALEIADREVRLLVFEVYDGRQNVLRVERVAHDGVDGQKIVNEAAVVKAVNTALANAQAALGYRIEKVLLAIPSLNVKQNRSKVRVQIEDGAKNIRLFHVQQGYHSALEKKAGDNVEFVNATRILYEVDGQTSQKLPVGQECSEFIMDVESVHADKEAIYTYGRIVEQANLEILDIFLDSYAASLESGAMVQSQDRPMIQLILEADHTTLSFFMNGRMLNTIVLEKGYHSFIDALQKKYGLSEDVSYRLLQNIFSSDPEKNLDFVIYIDQKDDQRIEITAHELFESVYGPIQQWIQDINKGCEPLLSAGDVRYSITGKGANIPVLKEMLDQFNADAQIYQPSLIGARDDALTTVLGVGYAWQNQNKIAHSDKISANNNELEASLESIRSRSKQAEGSFTKKMKSVILGNNS